MLGKKKTTEECKDCKYWHGGYCHHIYANGCYHGSLWWPKYDVITKAETEIQKVCNTLDIMIERELLYKENSKGFLYYLVNLRKYYEELREKEKKENAECK